MVVDFETYRRLGFIKKMIAARLVVFLISCGTVFMSINTYPTNSIYLTAVITIIAAIVSALCFYYLVMEINDYFVTKHRSPI